MSKVLNPIPNNGSVTPEQAEASAANAQAIIQQRLKALENGDITPEDLKVHHLGEIADGNAKSSYPTVVVDLPSKGLLYPADNPMSLGYVEMKPMTAREEDILTTESYLKKGIVLDKLFQSLIVTKINYDSMLIGDRDAIMIAARIYGYGAEYNSKITTPSGKIQMVTVNLEEIPHKEFDSTLDAYAQGVNQFEFTTSSNNVIKFKLLTNGDQKEIQENLKKVKHGDARDTQLTTRLYQMILSVDGNEDRRYIKSFVENDFRAIDSRKFRDYIAKIQPGVDMTIEVVDEDTGEPFRTQIAFGLDFFWTNV